MKKSRYGYKMLISNCVYLLFIFKFAKYTRITTFAF